MRNLLIQLWKSTISVVNVKILQKITDFIRVIICYFWREIFEIFKMSFSDKFDYSLIFFLLNIFQNSFFFFFSHFNHLFTSITVEILFAFSAKIFVMLSGFEYLFLFSSILFKLKSLTASWTFCFFNTHVWLYHFFFSVSLEYEKLFSFYNSEVFLKNTLALSVTKFENFPTIISTETSSWTILCNKWTSFFKLFTKFSLCSSFHLTLQVYLVVASLDLSVPILRLNDRKLVRDSKIHCTHVQSCLIGMKSYFHYLLNNLLHFHRYVWNMSFYQYLEKYGHSQCAFLSSYKGQVGDHQIYLQRCQLINALKACQEKICHNQNPAIYYYDQ